MPWPKLIHSAFSLSNVFSHFLAIIPAINLALSEGDPIDLEIGQARESLTPAKRLGWINNNLCIYCGDANHYAGSCLKANRKTMLRKMIVYGKEQSASLKALVKPLTPSTPLLSLNSENL